MRNVLARCLRSRGRGRTGRVAVLPVLIAALVGLVFAIPALAVHDTGAFELDGNAVNGTPLPAGDDWDNVCHQVLGSDCSTTSNTTGATAVDWVAEPNLDASIFTGGGSKDPQDINQWAWKDGAGGLPAKDNLLHSFAARYSTITCHGTPKRPAVVATTDLVATVPESLYTTVGRVLNLVTLPLPIPPFMIATNLCWHTRTHSDATAAGFRDIVRRAVASTQRPVTASRARNTTAKRRPR